MSLYRVENPDFTTGLWYNVNDNSKTNLIQELKLTNETLPMEYDERLSKEKWRSAAGTLEQLKYWFTEEDLIKLTPLGFKLFEIESTIISEWKTDLYTHPIFQEQGVTSRKELDIKILSGK